ANGPWTPWRSRRAWRRTASPTGPRRASGTGTCSRWRRRCTPGPPMTGSRPHPRRPWTPPGCAPPGSCSPCCPEPWPRRPRPPATAPVLALAWSCAPAAWSAHLLAVQARRRLTTSRGLEEFATSVRPVLLSTFALYLCALTTLLALCTAALNEPAAYAQTLP